MVRIRRFGVVRTATVVAVMYAVLALIFALIFALITLLGVAVVPNSGAAAGASFIGVLVLGVIVTLFYAVIGWIFTAIACALYNFVAGRVGGIEIQIESTTPLGPGGGYPAYGYPGYPAPAQYPAQPQYPVQAQYPAPGQPGGPPPPVR